MAPGGVERGGGGGGGGGGEDADDDGQEEQQEEERKKGSLIGSDSPLMRPCLASSAQATKVFELCAREAAQIFGGASYVRSGQGEKVERLYREVTRQGSSGAASAELPPPPLSPSLPPMSSSLTYLHLWTLHAIWGKAA